MFRRLLLLCALLSCLTVLPPPAAASHRPVLLLHSYHQGFPWTDGITDSIRSTFADSGVDVRLDIEYMDTKRIFTEEYLRTLTRLLRIKHRSVPYELIICADNNAYEFLASIHDSFFPGVPVVFCGFNGPLPNRKTAGMPLTGVGEEVAFTETLGVIRALQPDVRELVVITDETPTGRRNLERILGLMAGRDDLRLVSLAGESMPVLLRRLSRLGPNTAVYLTLYSRDGTGRFFEYDESIRMICESSNAPVYGGWDFCLGHGIVGGVLVSARSQGETAAKLGLRILRGESATDIPMIPNGPNRPMFDYNVLEKFGLDVSKLPPDSMMINRRTGFIAEHSRLVLAVSATFVVLLALVVLLTRSIWRRRTAESKLRASGDRYRDLVDNLPGAVYRTAPGQDWRLLFVSDAIKEITGYPPDRFAGAEGLTMRELRLPEERETVERAVYDSVSAERAYLLEYRIVDSDGRTRWVQDKGRGQFSDGGELTSLDGVLLDISDRREAGEEVRRLQGLLASIIDSMPSMIIGVGGDGLVTLWNHGAETATGIPSDQAVGHSFETVYPRLAMGRERVRLAMERREIQREEKVLRETAGVVRFEDVTIYPLTEGGQRGAVIRVDDVTSRVRIEEMMIQTEKMLSVGGLAAGMAHEINNPLGIILQSAQGALRRFSADIAANRTEAEALGVDLEKVREYMLRRGILGYLDGIRTAGERAAQIARNMLEFSRKSDAVKTLRKIEDLLERTVDLVSSDYDLKRKYDFRKVRVVRDYASGLPEVPVSETEIEQVLLNIIKNAAEAMAGHNFGGREPTIILRTKPDGHMVRIEIEDNGPGMPDEVRKRIFEPFFTTKATGKGTGLGLSVSYFIIAKNHGGQFEVESTPGKGSKFILRLPVALHPA